MTLLLRMVSFFNLCCHLFLARRFAALKLWTAPAVDSTLTESSSPHAALLKSGTLKQHEFFRIRESCVWEKSSVSGLSRQFDSEEAYENSTYAEMFHNGNIKNGSESMIGMNMCNHVHRDDGANWHILHVGPFEMQANGWQDIDFVLFAFNTIWEETRERGEQIAILNALLHPAYSDGSLVSNPPLHFHHGFIERYFGVFIGAAGLSSVMAEGVGDRSCAGEDGAWCFWFLGDPHYKKVVRQPLQVKATLNDVRASGGASFQFWMDAAIQWNWDSRVKKRHELFYIHIVNPLFLSPGHPTSTYPQPLVQNLYWYSVRMPFSGAFAPGSLNSAHHHGKSCGTTDTQLFLATEHELGLSKLPGKAMLPWEVYIPEEHGLTIGEVRTHMAEHLQGAFTECTRTLLATRCPRRFFAFNATYEVVEMEKIHTKYSFSQQALLVVERDNEIQMVKPKGMLADRRATMTYEATDLSIRKGDIVTAVMFSTTGLASGIGVPSQDAGIKYCNNHLHIHAHFLPEETELDRSGMAVMGARSGMIQFLPYSEESRLATQPGPCFASSEDERNALFWDGKTRVTSNETCHSHLNAFRSGELHEKCASAPGCALIP